MHPLLRNGGLAAVCVGIAALAKYLLQPLIEHESPFVLFYAAVVISAWYGGLPAGLLATALAGSAVGAIFIEPSANALLTDRGQALRLMIFLLEGAFISFLAGHLHRARAHLDVAQTRGRATEENFRLLVSSVQDYAIFLLDPRGNVASWNAGAERIKGYRPEEIVGRHFSTFYSAEDVAAGKPEWELESARRDGRVEDEGWRVRKDGTRFWANVVLTALRDEEGNLRGFAKVTRDITERRDLLERERAARMAAEEYARKAEASAREADTALAQVQQASRAKDEFLTTLSHEFRTPLTAIIGWTALLRDRDLDAESVREAVEAIEHSASAQARLIDDVLDVARSATGKLHLELTDTDLAQLARNVVDSIRGLAEAKRIELRLHVRSERIPLRADPVRLQQVLWNLLSNAVKFTPPAGAIHTTVYATEQEGVVVVRDTGIGIEPEFLPQMFERFRQADSSTTRAAGGLGLGLAIARELAELHGGRIDAFSEGPGHGSTFTFAVPMLPLPEAEPRPPRMQYPDLRGRTILLLEDDANARRVLAALVRECGGAVVVTSSVEEALARYEAQRPDVILADIAMAGRDGFELIRRVREHDRVTPAIAVTAIYTASGDRERLLAAGFDDYRRKPVAPDDLAWAIANVKGDA